MIAGKMFFFFLIYNAQCVYDWRNFFFHFVVLSETSCYTDDCFSRLYLCYYNNILLYNIMSAIIFFFLHTSTRKRKHNGAINSCYSNFFVNYEIYILTKKTKKESNGYNIIPSSLSFKIIYYIFAYLFGRSGYIQNRQNKCAFRFYNYSSRYVIDSNH